MLTQAIKNILEREDIDIPLRSKDALIKALTMHGFIVNLAIFPDRALDIIYGNEFEIGYCGEWSYDYKNKKISYTRYEVVELCEEDRIAWLEMVKK